jgi:hypothetical protein
VTQFRTPDCLTVCSCVISDYCKPTVGGLLSTVLCSTYFGHRLRCFGISCDQVLLSTLEEKRELLERGTWGAALRKCDYFGHIVHSDLIMPIMPYRQLGNRSLMFHDKTMDISKQKVIKVYFWTWMNELLQISSPRTRCVLQSFCESCLLIQSYLGTNATNWDVFPISHMLKILNSFLCKYVDDCVMWYCWTSGISDAEFS